NRNLRAAVDLQVGIGILHRIHVAGLSGKIEQVVLILDQVAHAVRIPNIGDVDAHPIFYSGDVEEIAAVFWYQAVEQHNLRAQLDQPAREIRADETQPARDEDILALERRHVGAFYRAWYRIGGMKRTLVFLISWASFAADVPMGKAEDV